MVSRKLKRHEVAVQLLNLFLHDLQLVADLIL